MIGIVAASRVQIPTDAILYYKFDGNVNDSSSSANNGVATGSPTYTTGVRGEANGAISLNGTTQFVNSGANLALSSINVASVSLWVKYANQDSKFIFDYSANSDSNSAFGAYAGLTSLGATNKILVSSHSSLGYNIIYNNAVISDSNWHHVVIVVDRSLDASNEIKLYVDGSLSSITLHPSYRINNDANFIADKMYIGRRNGGGYYLAGQLSKFRVYSRALTATEVAALYNE